MEYFHRVLNDLKQGENVDLYVTVFVSVFVAALSLFDLVPQRVMTSLTLAVMALLINSILGIRHRLEMLDRISEDIRTDARDLNIAIKDYLADATSVIGFSFERHESFSEAFHHWIGLYEYIDELDVVAYTSNSYLEHVRMKPRRIGRLRILLFYEDYESVQDEGDSEMQEPPLALTRAIAGWEYLHQNGEIEDLEIRRHQSSANFYFSTVNGQRGLFGLLWPSGFSGLEPRETLTISGETKQSRQLIAHAMSWFEAMWEEAKVVKSIGKKERY